MPLHKFQHLFCKTYFCRFKNLSFNTEVKTDQSRIKVLLLVNICPSNVSCSQGETIKGVFYLCPSNIDIFGCADRTPQS